VRRWAYERRGRDSNPRSTKRPTTVFETAQFAGCHDLGRHPWQSTGGGDELVIEAHGSSGPGELGRDSTAPRPADPAVQRELVDASVGGAHFLRLRHESGSVTTRKPIPASSRAKPMMIVKFATPQRSRMSGFGRSIRYREATLYLNALEKPAIAQLRILGRLRRPRKRR
jgi:hypothetical protein